MKRHRKFAAPVIVTAVMIAYYAAYFALLITVIENLILKILLAAVPLLLSGVMIGVCVQRIREIGKGEEDDLSQY